MKKILDPVIAICIAGMLIGCIATDQEWVHADKPNKDGLNYHRLVPGHIRWYQYEKHHWNLGGKPQAFMGGIWYTITTPSDWFWYGPYKLTPKEQFKKYWRKDCPSCKASFEALLIAISERQKMRNALKDDPSRDTERHILERQIEIMDENNCLNGDLTTPFEERFK